MKYTYGPVPSRRLGLSLGVDIVPHKTCTLSCVYCQIGNTPETTLERRHYVPVEEVLDEIRSLFERGVQTDWVTFSGSGEPTLHAGIGDLIRGVRDITDVPVCVITNGTLLWDPQVRRDILAADAVMPSLDSARPETFAKICRPHQDLDVERIIEGLRLFRKEFGGKLWLEIVFVAGVNDSPGELEALKRAADAIDPDSVQLNTVVRPPAESSARPVSMSRLEEIRDFFGEKAEIIAAFRSAPQKKPRPGLDGVRDYLRRRPGSLDDIVTSLGITGRQAEDYLRTLADAGEAVEREHFGKRFWEFRAKENDG